MPTELSLINFEQLANAIFLVSTLYAFVSGNRARQAELEKLQGISTSGQTSNAEKSAQLAYISTGLAVVSYVIFTLISVARKNNLEKEAQAGTTNISVTPALVLAIGFAIALLGAIIRLPAIQQRIREAQEVVL